MLNQESACILEFVGTRVKEIKAKTDPAAQWFWIPMECNPADMGTRPNERLAKMERGSPY